MSAERSTSRRRVLAAGGAGVGTVALSACTGGEYQGSALTETPRPGENGSGADAGDAASGTPLVELARVPVGGAVVRTGPAGEPIVVAQPREGEVVAHSAVCTHMGCTVRPSENLLNCPCHGSTFRPASGEVVRGPAQSALPEIPVRVESGTVVLA